ACGISLCLDLVLNHTAKQHEWAQRAMAGEEDYLVDHHTYVIASDGDLMEGVSHEACSLAGHLALSKLIVLFDDNGISIDGPTSLSFSDDVTLRFQSYNWDVQEIDGHDPAAIEAAIAQAKTTDKPSIIRCKTQIGFGAPNKVNTAGVHGAPLGADEIAGTRAALGWSHEPFEVPAAIKRVWEQAGSRGHEARDAWNTRHGAHAQKAAFDAAMSGYLPADLADTIKQVKQQASEEQPKLATRAASGKVLDAIMPVVANLIGGSADLTGSNNTKTETGGILSRDHYAGRYIHYGIREHGMAAAMNGMALHGGIIPYSGTFLAFADYNRPSLRLAALMEQRVIQVKTHDSIGLGEDGPTHQPVEQLAALRAIPNLNVFRPADLVETAEAWEVALNSPKTPSILALTRQGLPTLRTEHVDDNKVAKGAYVLREPAAGAVAVIMASGSEVEIAEAAADLLAAQDIHVRVVSCPCLDLFDQQPADYQASVLGTDMPRVAIEAAIAMGWEKYLGPEGVFIGMNSFGASGPYKALYEHFGITAEAAVDAVKSLLN
ncbi:MAG: transketolase C-terminal domain-containing protein, partial [Pseudomonadota bacterium]